METVEWSCWQLFFNVVENNNKYHVEDLKESRLYVDQWK
jgi:hypothetical protein